MTSVKIHCYRILELAIGSNRFSWVIYMSRFLIILCDILVVDMNSMKIHYYRSVEVRNVGNNRLKFFKIDYVPRKLLHW